MLHGPVVSGNKDSYLGQVIFPVHEKRASKIMKHLEQGIL